MLLLLTWYFSYVIRLLAAILSSIDLFVIGSGSMLFWRTFCSFVLNWKRRLFWFEGMYTLESFPYSFLTLSYGCGFLDCWSGSSNIFSSKVLKLDLWSIFLESLDLLLDLLRLALFGELEKSDFFCRKPNRLLLSLLLILILLSGNKICININNSF